MLFSLFHRRGLKRAIFVLFTLWFVSCEMDGDDPLLNGLPSGNWVSAYSEIFQISGTHFSSLYGDTTAYSGTIENIRQDGIGAGYITIQLDTVTTYDPPYDSGNQTVGHFYVIHWRNLRADSVELSGAYKDGSPDEETQEQAEQTFTVQNGCFAMYSACRKQ